MAERSVLIVEDGDAVVSGLRRHLAGQPVTVEFARDAISAVSLLSNGRFCGLVLDLTLSDGGGLDVLRHIENARLEMPAVVVAQALPAHVRDALDDRYVKLVLPKPVDQRLLATIVLGLCGIQT